MPKIDTSPGRFPKAVMEKQVKYQDRGISISSASLTKMSKLSNRCDSDDEGMSKEMRNQKELLTDLRTRDVEQLNMCHEILDFSVVKLKTENSLRRGLLRPKDKNGADIMDDLRVKAVKEKELAKKLAKEEKLRKKIEKLKKMK